MSDLIAEINPAHDDVVILILKICYRLSKGIKEIIFTNDKIKYKINPQNK